MYLVQCCDGYQMRARAYRSTYVYCSGVALHTGTDENAYQRMGLLRTPSRCVYVISLASRQFKCFPLSWRIFVLWVTKLNVSHAHTCSFFTRLASFYKFTAVSHCVRTIISVYCSDLAFSAWLALCTVLGDRNLASNHQVRQVSTTAMQLCLVFKHPLTNLQKRKQKIK